MEKIQFQIVFRKPRYPVVVVSKDKLCSAFEINQLANCCISSTPIDDKSYVQVIDSTGEEFWYNLEHYALSPGFAFKKWTKKKIIETYNNSSNARRINQKYSLKSLSSKRLDKIVYDICSLLRS
jgi:hypothetical protein